MNTEYLTVSRPGADEIVIQKSRFIGYAAPAASEEEALEFIRSIREKHRDATHNCYAYIIGSNQGTIRYSDDGEPSGTAGLPMDEVRRLGALKDSEINEAKKVLAYEVTKLVHGQEEAEKAASAAAALFGQGGPSADVPSLALSEADLAADARISTLLVRSGLCKSQSDARKQIEQNAVSLGDEKVHDPAAVISAELIGKNGILLKKGKKGFCRIVLS